MQMETFASILLMEICVFFIGKTLAFGVPALVHILQKDDKKISKKVVPRCLVLSPTRELAQQVFLIISVFVST